MRRAQTRINNNNNNKKKCKTRVYGSGGQTNADLPNIMGLRIFFSPLSVPPPPLWPAPAGHLHTRHGIALALETVSNVPEKKPSNSELLQQLWQFAGQRRHCNTYLCNDSAKSS